MNRRELLKALAAGGVITAAGLWMPGTKLISIPKKPILGQARWFIDYGKEPSVGVYAACDKSGVIHILDTKEFSQAESQFHRDFMLHGRASKRIYYD